MIWTCSHPSSACCMRQSLASSLPTCVQMRSAPHAAHLPYMPASVPPAFLDILQHAWYEHGKPLLLQYKASLQTGAFSGSCSSISEALSAHVLLPAALCCGGFVSLGMVALLARQYQQFLTRRHLVRVSASHVLMHFEQPTKLCMCRMR